MKNILIAMFTICFLASCSKDDDTPPTPQKFNYRIKEERDGNNVLLVSYEYNNNNQVIKELNSAGVVQTFYLYNSAGYLTNKAVKNSTDYSYVLDANGRVLEEIRDYTDNSKEKIVFIYDATGNKTEEKYYTLDSSSNYIYRNSTLFYYNSKNQLVQEVTPQYDVLQGFILEPVLEESKEYQYDERGNRNLETRKKAIVVDGNLVKLLQTAYIYDNIKPDYYPNSTLSKNNAIEVKQTSYNNAGSITGTVTFTANYTYNESGYITKSSVIPFGDQNFVLEKIN